MLDHKWPFFSIHRNSSLGLWNHQMGKCFLVTRDHFPLELCSKMFVIDYGCVGECTEIFSAFTFCLHQNLCTEKYTYIDRISCVLKCTPAFAVDVTCYLKCVKICETKASNQPLWCGVAESSHISCTILFNPKVVFLANARLRDHGVPCAWAPLHMLAFRISCILKVHKYELSSVLLQLFTNLSVVSKLKLEIGRG